MKNLLFNSDSFVYFFPISILAIAVMLQFYFAKKEYIFKGRVKDHFTEENKYSAAILEVHSESLKSPLTVTADIYGFFQHVYKTENPEQTITYLVYENVQNCNPVKYTIKPSDYKEGVVNLPDFYTCINLLKSQQ